MIGPEIFDFDVDLGPVKYPFAWVHVICDSPALQSRFQRFVAMDQPFV